MSKIFSIAFLVSLSFFISCDKEQIEEIKKEPEVYIVGYENDDLSENKSKHVAKIWKNGIETAITDGTSTELLEAIFIEGENIFLAGHGTGSNDNTLIAKLWKNGIETKLGTVRSFTQDIYVSNGNVVIVGEINNKTAVWNNGILSTVSKDSVSYGVLNSVFIENNDVYVAGSEILLDSDNYVSKIWKNGVEIFNTNNNKKPVAIKEIFVSKNDVYAVGQIDNSAILWKNGVEQRYGNFYSSLTAIDIVNNDIYLTGFERNNINNGVAKVWKNGIETIISDGTVHTIPESIKVVNDTVYIVGNAFQNGIGVVKLWKNGIETDITDGTKYAKAKDVFIKK